MQVCFFPGGEKVPSFPSAPAIPPPQPQLERHTHTHTQLTCQAEMKGIAFGTYTKSGIEVGFEQPGFGPALPKFDTDAQPPVATSHSSNLHEPPKTILV